MRAFRKGLALTVLRNDPPTDESDVERLAFELIERYEAGDVAGATELFHRDCTVESSSAGLLRGVEAVREHHRALSALPLYEIYNARVELVSDSAVLVSGRLRWLDEHQLVDRPGRWLLEARDGRLWRLAIVESLAEAQRLAAAD